MWYLLVLGVILGYKLVGTRWGLRGPRATPTVPLNALVPVKAKLRLWSRHAMSHKVWCPAQSLGPSGAKVFFSVKWAAEICPTPCESFFYEFLFFAQKNWPGRSASTCFGFNFLWLRLLFFFFFPFFFPIWKKVGTIAINITLVFGGM